MLNIHFYSYSYHEISTKKQVNVDANPVQINV